MILYLPGTGIGITRPFYYISEKTHLPWTTGKQTVNNDYRPQNVGTLTLTDLPEKDWTLSDTIMDKNKSLPFRMWIAPGTKHVRGLILATKILAEEAFVNNPSIRKVAAEEGLAIIKSDAKAYAMFDITKGEDLLLMRMLHKLAQISGFPEIEFAPWLTFGHSTAGHFAKNLAYWKPERTFGIVYFKSGQFHYPKWTIPGTSIQNIPVLAINGQFEEYGPHGPHPKGESLQAQWLAVRDTFMLMRKTGHLVSLIVEPGRGHTNFSQKDADYIALFIKKAAQYKIARHKYATKSPIKLKNIKESAGVLSDTCIAGLIANPNIIYTDVLKPNGKFHDINKIPTFWHFDREIAEAWVKFHETK